MPLLLRTEGNAVDGGAALAVSESQAEDLSAGQNEQLYVDSSEVGSVAVPMENSLVDSLNGKKPEMGNNKVPDIALHYPYMYSTSLL